MRMNVICSVLLVMISGVNLRSQSASGMRAICLTQVGNVDHSIFPLAISDSQRGAAWCQRELGEQEISPQVVTPATMTQFLADLRTVSGSKSEATAGSSAFKVIVFQAEGKRELILNQPTTHDLVKRMERHCKGEGLHKLLAYVEQQTRMPRNN